MKTEITFVGKPNIFRLYKGLGYEVIRITDRKTGEIKYEKEKKDENKKHSWRNAI